MAILEILRRNAARKSDLDADKELLTRAANEIERLRTPFRSVDNQDWEYLLNEHALGDGGRDRFWKTVLREMRDALSETK